MSDPISLSELTITAHPSALLTNQMSPPQKTLYYQIRAYMWAKLFNYGYIRLWLIDWYNQIQNLIEANLRKDKQDNIIIVDSISSAVIEDTPTYLGW